MKRVLFGSLVTTLILTTACGTTGGSSTNSGNTSGSSNTTSSTSTSIKVGYAINTLANPFFVAVKDGAQRQANTLGVKLVVEDANDDLSKQLNEVEDLIQQRVNVIILDAVDSNGDIPAVKEANQAGIPVIVTGRKVNGGDIAAFLGYDEVQHGQKAGEYLSQLLNAKGNVVELQGIMGTNVAQDRSKGFEQAMAKYSDIKIVAKQPADFDRAKALSVMENILQANPNINGLYAANDEMALGAIQAIKAANRTGIVVVSNDGTMDALNDVKSGAIAGDMAIFPNQYGEKAIQVAYSVAQKQSQPSYIELPSVFVTKDNVDDAIQQSKN